MSPGDPAPFGVLLRGHRRDAGMTQAELALLAGLGVRTVRDLELGRAARPQRSTLELLARALGLGGGQLATFFAAARGQVAATDQPATAPSAVLPPAPELIGRADAIAALVEHVAARPGLTTLVGLAGVGKSALALAVAHQGAAHFPGGVAGIRITDGDGVADVREVICAILGVSRPDELPSRLAEPVLVLVDSVERAPEALRIVLGELVAGSPRLRVVASGRAPLGLPAEHVWPVPPLAVPPSGVTTLAEAQQHPASTLFLARWAQVRGRALAEVDVGSVITLVRRLGGLPLAIELAAARGRVLDPPEMLARYGNRLLELGSSDGGLTEPVTLRDVVTASYRLLDPAHRWVLRRLSGFAYRWSVELAEELLTPSPYPALDLVEALERLVELGLVQVRGEGALRFVLLDVVKAFAAEQAEAAQELREIRRRHAAVFATYAARVAPEMVGAKLSASVGRLDDVASDLWSALTHAAYDDPHTALCLASKLPRWWRVRGRDNEGRQWLLRLLADERTADADPSLRTWAQLGVAQLAVEHGAGLTELPRAEEALREFMFRGDVTGELAARALLLAVHQSVGDFADAKRHGEASLALATRTGRIRDMAVAQNNLIWHDLRGADLAAAQRRLAAVDRLSVRCGEDKLRALARANLAEVLRLDGRYDEAIKVGQQAAEMLADVGNPGERRRLLGVIGLSYALAGRVEDAEKMLAEVRSHLNAAADGALASIVDWSSAQQPERESAGQPGAGHPNTGQLGALGGGTGQADAPEAGPPEDWDCAMIEATLARARGHRTLAASWYASAARLSDGVSDLRDVAEALVGLVMTSDGPEPRRRLDQLCRQAGITLTERERAQLAQLG